MPARCAWRGNAWRTDDGCKDAAKVGRLCEKHAAVKCAGCNGPATHECGECLQFVCGAPLCDGCDHDRSEYCYRHKPTERSPR
jgi:hypothetical protein